MRVGLFFLTLGLAAGAGAAPDPAVRLEAIVQGFVDPVPGGQPGETFWILGEPAMHWGDVVFTAAGTFGTVGVYCYCDGSVIAVADRNTPVPGLPDGVVASFGDFFLPVVIYEGKVVFASEVAIEGGGGFRGIYRWDPPAVSVVMDRWSDLPLGYPDEFFEFLDLSFDQAGVTFQVVGDVELAIYRFSQGQYETLVSLETPMPVDPPVDFRGFLHGFADGRDLTFVGTAPGIAGVFKATDSELSLVMDNHTEVPDGEAGEIFVVNSPSPVVGNGTVLFRSGTSAMMGGLFRQKNGVLEPVATRRTMNPLTGLPFDTFANQKSADGDNYAFLAGNDHDVTLFFGDAQDRWYAIATEDEEIDGQNLEFFLMSKHAISGNKIAFNAYREFDETIFIATVGESPLEIPTLGQAALLTLSLLLGLGGLLILRRTT